MDGSKSNYDKLRILLIPKDDCQVILLLSSQVNVKSFSSCSGFIDGVEAMAGLFQPLDILSCFPSLAVSTYSIGSAFASLSVESRSIFTTRPLAYSNSTRGLLNSSISTVCWISDSAQLVGPFYDISVYVEEDLFAYLFRWRSVYVKLSLHWRLSYYSN